jgi:hypothetical protein
MDNGVGVADVGVLAGLYGGISGNGGRNGYGGYDQGNFRGDGSAVKASLDDQQHFISFAASAARSDSIQAADTLARGQDNITRTISEQSMDTRLFETQRLIGEQALQAAIRRGEDNIRTANQFSDTQRQIADAAAAAALCCCETKAELAAIRQFQSDSKDTNSTNLLIGAIQSGNAALLAAINNGGGHHG